MDVPEVKSRRVMSCQGAALMAIVVVAALVGLVAIELDVLVKR
jgi:hypothetical protein